MTDTFHFSGRLLLGLFLMLLLSPAPAARALAPAQFEARSFAHKAGHVLPYRILYPANYNPRQHYPLVVVLHGSGERGTDNQAQLVHGSRLFLDPATRQNFPAIVVFPQCPPDSYWAAVEVDRSQSPLGLRFQYADGPTWPLAAALALTRQLMRHEGIDKHRVYIMGLSMGGMGTFEALYRAPRLFAAAVPICGAGDPAAVGRYARRVPLWVFHGGSDNVVAPEQSRQMVAALQQRGAQVRYTEYPGVNHNSWDKAFAEPELLPWLFGHRR